MIDVAYISRIQQADLHAALNIVYGRIVLVILEIFVDSTVFKMSSASQK
jgi:hypothetical protein